MALLLNSSYDAAAYHSGVMNAAAVEMLLDESSMQINAPSIHRRSSRGSNSYRHGRPMRVTKTTSANNSPREGMLARRRTLMSDAPQNRTVMMARQAALGVPADISKHTIQRSTRPVSWHPSSRMSMNAIYNPGFLTSNHATGQYIDIDSQMQADAGYFTSPPSTVSSPVAQFTNFTPQVTHGHMNLYPIANQGPEQYLDYQSCVPSQQPYFQSFSQCYMEDLVPPVSSGLDWNNFAANGFEEADTAPPTPDNFLPIQHPETDFASTESVPYHSLSDDEPEGEILIGMGLYDTPDKDTVDPHLETYRSMVASQRLGTPVRKEPARGKGLKLEETWQPPASDEEDEDAESEEDTEIQNQAGDDEEFQLSSSNDMNMTLPTQFHGNSYTSAGWI